MIHPDTKLKFISHEIGYGVVATRFIPMGTITWIFDPLDQVFTPERIRQLDPYFQEKLHTYCYRDNKDGRPEEFLLRLREPPGCF